MKLEEAFSSAQEQIGSSLKVARVAMRLTQKEIANILKISAERIKAIEEESLRISLEETKLFCLAIGVTIEKVISMALHMNGIKEVPEDELLKELKSELEYRKWKDVQQ